MLKKTPVVMLPTNEKATSYQSNFEGILLCIDEKCVVFNKLQINKYPSIGYVTSMWTPQHLYFLSKEEIKVGDWYITNDNILLRCNKTLLGLVYAEDDYGRNKNSIKGKVIATTDSSLKLNDSIQIGQFHKTLPIILPQPSQSFIEKYIEKYNKGEEITEVMVEYEPKPIYGNNGSVFPIEYQLKVNQKDNTITIKPIKDSWNKKEHELDLIYCVSYVAASLGLTPTSNEMKKFNDATHEWIKENL